MARRLPKVCPFLVTVDLKLKWPELPRPTLAHSQTSLGTEINEDHMLQI